MGNEKTVDATLEASGEYASLSTNAIGSDRKIVLNRLDHPSVVAASIWLATLGALSFMFMPLIVGGVVDTLGFTNQQAGFISAADTGGMGLLSALSIFWARKFDWRKTGALGIFLMVVANLLSAEVSDFWSLFFLRFLDGCGGGILISVGLACQSDYKNPGRAFSLFVGLEMFVNGTIYYVMPHIMQNYGLASLMWVIAAIATTGIVALFWLPGYGLDRTEKRQATNNALLVWAVALLGALFFYMSQGGVWAFLERIGAAAGIGSAEIGEAFVISFIPGIIGALGATWFIDVLGRFRTLAIIFVGEVACLYMLTLDVDYLSFLIVLCLFEFCWSMSLPLLMSAFTKLDVSGRLVLLLFATAKLGYTLGPALMGVVFVGQDFLPAIFLGLALCVTGLSFVMGLLKWVKIS